MWNLGITFENCIGRWAGFWLHYPVLLSSSVSRFLLQLIDSNYSFRDSRLSSWLCFPCHVWFVVMGVKPTQPPSVCTLRLGGWKYGQILRGQRTRDQNHIGEKWCLISVTLDALGCSSVLGQHMMGEVYESLLFSALWNVFDLPSRDDECFEVDLNPTETMVMRYA